MPWLPRSEFLSWPDDGDALSTEQVIDLYENGYAGAKHSPEAWAEFHATMNYPDGDAACHEFGLAETGAGKLVVPFVHVLELFPGCWPGAQGQARGDCVSWGTRNASLLTMVCDVVSGQPDEKTGKPEEAPEVPAEGVADGVLSTEAFYWHRGYNSDGWHCPAAAMVATKKSGLVVRKNYPNWGVDLTRYSGSNAGKYGARAPGQEITSEADDHLIHQAAEAQSFEARRDFLYTGYGLLDCGGEGYSNRRDENGVSSRSGSWAHSMCEIAVDDRDVVKQKYGGPLVCILNSWAKWNSGGRDIYQSAALVPAGKKDLWARLGIVNASTGNIQIPEGSFWAKWSEVSRREAIAFSGALGWPRKKLPDLDWYV
jgi:hypothetical protein